MIDGVFMCVCVFFMSKIFVYSCKWALACRISKAVIYQVQKWPYDFALLYLLQPVLYGHLKYLYETVVIFVASFAALLAWSLKKKITMRLFIRVNEEYIKVIFIYNNDCSLYLVTKMFFQLQNDLTADMIDRIFLYPKCCYWRCCGYQGKTWVEAYGNE